MAAILNLAKLFYGVTCYDVERTELSPLPEVFDFDNPEACAKQIFAIMSNASGGHPLRGCRLKINREREQANMTANGVHIYYANPETPKFKTVEDAFAAEQSAEVFELGSVVTDQYGDGWKRAIWEK